MKILKTSIVLIFAVAFVIACGGAANTPNVAKNTPATPQTVATPVPQTDKADAGKELYAANCMICHKDTGKGGPSTIGGKKINADDLTADKMKKMSDDKMLAYIRDGVVDEGMPAFVDKLAEDEMRTVVQYVRTLQK